MQNKIATRSIMSYSQGFYSQILPIELRHNLKYDSTTKMYKGIWDDPLLQVICVPTESLYGIPQIILRTLLEDVDMVHYDSLDREVALLLLRSGFVKVYGDYIMLDSTTGKEQRLEEWLEHATL